MLAKIVVENFKSFDERSELNMISSTKIRTKTDHRICVGPKLRLLKHAVIYGANASGKSNLIDFMAFFLHVLSFGLPIEGMQCFCRNRKENENRDSLFEIQFEMDCKYYAYGFSTRLSEQRITGEWLYELHLNGSSSSIFERNGLRKPEIGDGLHVSKEELNRFDTYATDFADNKVGLFLSEMNRGKKYADGSNLQVFGRVLKWMTEKIVVITPDSRLINFQQYYNADSLSEINNMIQTFDTGVSNVRIEEVDVSDLEKMMPRPILDDMMRELNRRRSEEPDAPTFLSGRTDTSFFSIELGESGILKATTIKLKHGRSCFDFGFEDESDGTRRLFDLMDILLKKSDDTIFFVDELERSLHPKLTEHFLELFSEYHKNHKVQLIFTTHESSIMDQKLFRRDEIWFIERNEENNSRIYSLDRFKERYDKKLSKAYLEGRYGAIPVFRKFDFKEISKCQQ